MTATLNHPDYTTSDTVREMFAAGYLTTNEGRCDLSDYCINVLRDHVASGELKGDVRFPERKADLGAILAEECERIRGLGLKPDLDGLNAYCRCRRDGSFVRLARWNRVLIFGQIAARRFI